MGEEQVLDLARVDVLSTPDDHVFEPTLDAQITLLVHRGQVSGVVPTLGVDGFRRRLGLAVVSGHHHVAPRA